MRTYVTTASQICTQIQKRLKSVTYSLPQQMENSNLSFTPWSKMVGSSLYDFKFQRIRPLSSSSTGLVLRASLYSWPMQNNNIRDIHCYENQSYEFIYILLDCISNAFFFSKWTSSDSADICDKIATRCSIVNATPLLFASALAKSSFIFLYSCFSYIRNVLE